MRVSEDRYARDLRRLDLARRLLRYRVRTQSICDWTGLTDLRVRTLYRSYDPEEAAQRHRGPSPTRVQTLLRSPVLRCEASAIATLAYQLQVIPIRPIPDARRSLPGLEAGERLCKAFELYGRIVPSSRFTMDQFILLALSLAEGIDVLLRHCAHCHGSLLMERRPTERAICPWCRDAALPKNRTAGAAILAAHAAQLVEEPFSEPAEVYQHSLF